MPNNDIPSNPQENLKRLQSINAHFRSNLERKEAIYKKKLSAVQRLTEELDELPPVEDMSDEELKSAAKKEQIKLSFSIQAEKLDSEIKEIKGKLRWNEDYQETVKEVLARKGELTYTLSEKLNT